MTIKEKIIKEIQQSPQKYKKLQMKYKKSKKFYATMEELYQQGVIDEKNGMIVLTNEYKTKEKTNAKSEHIKKGELEGVVVKLTENYGFVRIENMPKDVFVAGKFMMGAVVGDKVELKKVPSKRHQFEGEIVQILEEKTNLIATIEKRGGKFVAVLKDAPVLALSIDNKRVQLANGEVVLVEVNGRGRGHRSLTAYIKENLGKINSSQRSVALLLAEKQIQKEFEPKVIQEANELIARLDMQREYQHRKDLTGECIFTIDSAKTKDIDDAISIYKNGEEYVLSVHIADVSHFVKPASFNNQVAFNRGTSIYFGDSVIPMLPPEYSNNICSLNPQVERLAFTCEIHLDESGKVKNYQFYKSVIKSALKGVYSEINAIYDHTASPEILKKYQAVLPSLELAQQLYAKLGKNRLMRGAMDIESDEAYILFDKKGKAVGIEKRTRGESEKIIEEFMLLANGCSANLAKKMAIPFVYRVHQEPDTEKLYALRENLKRFGLKLEIKKGETLQMALSRLLDKARGTDLEQFVHKGVLRCQAKAKYFAEPEGHFGLSLEDYAHFTSPIRRYPDLAIHRILTDVVNGVPKDKIKKKYEKFAKDASQQASDREVDAMQIERDATDIYKAEVMQSHIGEEWPGIISSVTNFGVYIALENTVEGLAHVSTLNVVNPVLQEGFRLYCPVTGKRYTIGDKVQVKVLSTDIFNGNIDFAIQE